MSAVECENLNKKFFSSREKKKKADDARSWLLRNLRAPRKIIRAVDGVSFSVPRGECFGVVGPNGSGKSTLIRIIATLILPDTGRVTVFGHDAVRESLTVRRFINRVSVEASFFKKLSPWENLAYAARLYGVPMAHARKHAADILKKLGFDTSRMNRSLTDLSRGMQQKVAIARALLTSPSLLLLDEPTTGLDPVSKEQVQDFVEYVRENHDATIIITTHDMEEAERVCDRLAVVDRGRFVALDTPAVLKGLVPPKDRPITLKDVFFHVTGATFAQRESAQKKN